MATKFIGDIATGEKFTNQQWEEKTKWTNHWALFYDPEKDRYSIKLMGTWLNVFPKRDDNVTKPTQKEESIDIADIPF